MLSSCHLLSGLDATPSFFLPAEGYLMIETVVTAVAITIYLIISDTVWPTALCLPAQWDRTVHSPPAIRTANAFCCYNGKWYLSASLLKPGGSVLALPTFISARDYCIDRLTIWRSVTRILLLLTISLAYRLGWSVILFPLMYSRVILIATKPG